MMLTLEVLPREAKESAAELRQRGAVPAVYYGRKEASTPIAINARQLASVWKQAGETTIITLKGAGHDVDTLIKDVQLHPVTGQLLHADFYALEKGKKVEIAVPLEFVGEAPAEKLGHIVVKSMHEISIEVAPQELPHSLEVDISSLENVGDQILVRDIKLPPSAELKVDPDEVIVSIAEFKEEKEEAPVPAEGAEVVPAADAAPSEGEAKSE